MAGAGAEALSWPEEKARWHDVITQLTTDHAGRLAEVCAEVGHLAPERVVVALHRLLGRGAIRHGFVGHIKHELRAALGVGERAARRIVQALRRLGILDGLPPDAYHDERGWFARGHSHFTFSLPEWARSRWWRKRPGPPSGPGGPLSRALAPAVTPSPPSATRKTKGDRSSNPVDTPAMGQPPAADYLAARRAFGRPSPRDR